MLTPEQFRLGLHQLKGECNADSRTVDVVGAVVEWFPVLLENTLLRCPLREPGAGATDLYRLATRAASDFGAHSKGEARLERALAVGWPAGSAFWPGRCAGFVSYQVPLFDRQGADGWRSIDLVGLSPAGRPQVWELKKDPPADGPFVMVVEAIAYGVALRHAWNRGHLAGAWAAAGLPGAGPLAEVELFGAAPAGYWAEARRKWLNTPAKRAALAALRTRAAAAGFPLTLVELAAEPLADAPFVRVAGATAFDPG